MDALNPADIRDHWDRIAPAVAECLLGDEDRPEDVYAACLYGHAHLYLAADGFVVFKKRRTRLGTELRVWCAHCTGPAGALVRYRPDVERLAKEIGARAAVFESHRPGFDRALPPGWKRVSAVYELEVGHG
ncbi:MAG: hypothetical protein EPN60_05295 [Nevskiaceae bacterium]|nr:MAG: hypothetical protein EPN60_05295 [Nevskiaceae bacterium]